MALELLVDYLDDLNQSDPAAGDAISQADDHMRNIKKALKQTFPGAGGAGFARALVALEDDIDLLAGADAAGLTTAQLLFLAGVTAGTAAASKALVLDALGDISGINELTATSLVGALTGNTAGTHTGAVVGTTVSASGGFTGDLTGTASLATLAANATLAATATNALACSGNAATSTKWAATITINGVAVDGSSNVTLPTAVNAINPSDTTMYPLLVGSNSIGNQNINTDAGITYNASTNVLSCTFSGDGSGVTNLDMGNVSAGVLAIANGGTSATSSTGTGNQVVLANSPSLSTPTLVSPKFVGGQLATMNVSSAGVISNGPSGWTITKGAGTGAYTLNHNLGITTGKAFLAVFDNSGAGRYLVVTRFTETTNAISYIIRDEATAGSLNVAHVLFFSIGDLGE